MKDLKEFVRLLAEGILYAMAEQKPVEIAAPEKSSRKISSVAFNPENDSDMNEVKNQLKQWKKEGLLNEDQILAFGATQGRGKRISAYTLAEREQLLDIYEQVKEKAF